MQPQFSRSLLAISTSHQSTHSIHQLLCHRRLPHGFSRLQQLHHRLSHQAALLITTSCHSNSSKYSRPYVLTFLLQKLELSFSSLMLLAGQQQWHSACKSQFRSSLNYSTQSVPKIFLVLLDILGFIISCNLTAIRLIDFTTAVLSNLL